MDDDNESWEAYANDLEEQVVARDRKISDLTAANERLHDVYAALEEGNDHLRGENERLRAALEEMLLVYRPVCFARLEDAARAGDAKERAEAALKVA